MTLNIFYKSRHNMTGVGQQRLYSSVYSFCILHTTYEIQLIIYQNKCFNIKIKIQNTKTHVYKKRNT